MGLFELLQKERCRIKSMDKYLLPGNFSVNFPQLYRPEDLFFNKEWYVIPQDFFRLYKNWFVPLANSTRRLFADSIPFPDMTTEELSIGTINWLKNNKLWMTLVYLLIYSGNPKEFTMILIFGISSLSTDFGETSEIKDWLSSKRKAVNNSLQLSSLVKSLK